MTENVTSAVLQQVQSSLVDGQPQTLGPVGCERLHDIVKGGFVERPALDDVEKGLFGFLGCHAEEGLVVQGHHLGADERQDARR